MKKQSVRVLCLLLSIAMLFSLLPVSAFAADVQEGGGISTQADGDLVIPGYTQVTALRQIKADRKYLIVAQAPDKTFYALHLNAAGTTGHGPGTAPYPDCTATLTVSGNTVSAVSTANTSTSIAMDDLHVTIAESSGSYTIKNGSYALQINSQMYVAANSAPSLTLSFVTDQNRFSIKNSSAGRYLTFNVNGATSTETHYPNLATGFCGMKDDQTVYVPIYLFIQGDLPVEPGMNLSNMLSGDKIGGGGTADENPDGQNSWVFTGGRAAQGSFADVKGARTYAGHFEEYVRYTNAKQLQPSGESTTPYFQRHVINAAYTGQTLQNIVDSFGTRIAPLKPRAVSYLVDEGGSGEVNFAANLKTLITNALGLQNNTGMIVIETLTAADKAAVDAVIDTLPSAQQANVLSVLFTLTATQKTNGYPNASGHFAMAQQLADAVAGATVSTNANWPYGAISASVMATDFPNKTSLDHTHGYTNPTTLSEGQQAIKTKVAGSDAMTWLFMGDSITHGAAWTGGYDTLAQLFEKFVKDDLGRKQDIVINAGSSGATTTSTINDLNRRLVKYDPDVVVLMLGTNDAGGSVAENTYKANIRTILDKIIDKGATAVLRTPPPTSKSGYDIATYAGYIRDVAAESKYAGKVILVDQYGLWTANDWSKVFTRDTLHPDESGHLWFVHQLIKELALWNDNYSVCRLEYVEMKEAGGITIPGYTQLTDISQLDENKGYLIVSQDSNGGLYALYPSKEGETLTSGFLTSPGGTNDGARAAQLDVSGNTVTAKWLKDDSALKMENLLFTIKKSDSRYVFTAFNGRHLNMGPHMFTEGEQTLTIASRGTAAVNAFEIKNPDLSKPRYLDFTKTGDPNAFHKGSETINTWGTDFWAPESMSMNIYLFASNTVEAQTAKQGLQKLIDEIKAANLSEAAYTRASWSALQSALTAAETIVADSSVGADAQEVTAAWDALRVAYEGLNEKPVAPDVPAGVTPIEDWRSMVPASGTSRNEPFKSGTGGSNKFRIPAIITLQHQSDESKNGRLLAAIDARWNHTGDACGLDTIVSYSDDTGASWNYNFANYFGDSTDSYAQYGTAFIDPVLLEGQDGTIYLMVDIWPGGIALNTAPNRPATATGYETINGTKRLVLYTDAPNASAAAYDYYVGDFAGGYAPVYEPIDDAADVFSGYYIDEYYYLYYTSQTDFANKTPANDKIYCQRLNNNEWVQQNVFFYKATLHVRDASYLWIVTSKDGGQTWGDPQMINGQVHPGTHSFYGVGPGAGLCIETHGEDGAIPNGTLILPVYVNPNEQAGFIYSTDGGNTWIRSNSYAAPSSVAATSESCLVQIDEKTVRHFYRESWKRSSTAVAYTDHTWNGTGWDTSDMITVSGANHYGACQVSAIKYSQQIDGKDLILYSAPDSGTGRQSGVIHAFLVNEDKTMTLYNTYAVNGDLAYAYSSLTETADGDIALLYESTSDRVVFKIIPFTDIVPALTVTGWEGNYDGQSHTVAVKAEPAGATLQYSTDGGSTWSSTKPTFTNAGTYTVRVKATWNADDNANWSISGNIEATATATVKINKVTPTLTITCVDGTALVANTDPTFTVSGVPGEGTVTLVCSNTAEGHDPNVDLTKQTNGTYTGTHRVEEGNFTLTATYTGNDNYNAATATYAITVAPSEFNIVAKDYTGTYDGQPHSINVTAADGVTLTYCETEDGEYTATLPQKTDAGTYTIYYKATKDDRTVAGSANVTIAKATPSIAILCGNEDHGDSHSISTTDLPLVLTITGVPAQNQGQFTLTTFNDAVRNLTRNANGTWTASPNLPPITRTYHFIAVFDPTHNQDGDEISNPNYERATAEFTVTVSRPPDEVINFNFNFADGVAIDPDVSTRGTLTVPYDGLPHGPLAALTYDTGLELTYHVSEEDAEIGSESWTSEEPTFRQPGTYTVSCMASPTNSPVAKVLTVVLKIEVQEIPTNLTITPDHDELEGGGTVTLTVAGMPEAGTLTVTCDKAGISVTETARGTYTVTLPDADAAYDFTASYSGAGSYQSADAACTVVVIGTSRPDAAKLSSLTLSEGTLTPAFSADTTAYTASVENSVESVTVTAAGADGAAAVVKKGDTVCANGVVTLAEGENVITVTANKVGLTGTTYTITITRASQVTPTVPVVPVVPSVPDGDTKTEVKENEDGTTTTIVTDNKTGTVTETTEKEDGTVEVVETKKDGTVTETTTDPEGGKVEKVTTPDEDVTITVTDNQGEVLAKVELSAEIPAPETRFVDVPEGHWADEAIHNIAALEVVEGVGGNRFNMNGDMTRGALATVLRRMSNGQEGLEASFADVDADKWYADGIAWAAKVGVVTGRSADTFAPEDTITREELAVMLCRYARLLGMDTTADSATLDSFKDGSSTHDWAADSIAWCVDNGILNGMGNDTLAPTATATRAQVAVMLQRFMDLMK